MKKLAYLLLILGLVFLVIGINIVKISLPSSIQFIFQYSLIIGIILVVISAVLLSQGKSSKEEEVPIYEGEGKKKRIVGYKRLK